MKTLIEKLAWICIGIGCIVFLIYIIKLGKSDYTLIRQIGDSDIERTGQIGDFFGGIVVSISRSFTVFFCIKIAVKGNCKSNQ